MSAPRMFPDLSLRWRPYPSIMDGMRPPPFVLDRGLWKSVLNLIVLEGSLGVLHREEPEAPAFSRRPQA